MTEIKFLIGIVSLTYFIFYLGYKFGKKTAVYTIALTTFLLGVNVISIYLYAYLMVLIIINYILHHDMFDDGDSDK
jgi:hypothetical protein